MQAVGEVVHVAGEDQLVRFGLLQQLFQALTHGLRPADGSQAEELAHGLALVRQPQAVHARYGLALHQALAADQRQDALERGGGQVLRLLIAVGCQQRYAKHHIRLVQHRRGAEVVAVDADRLVHVARCEVRGEGVRQALHAGQLGAEQAGAEQPDRHIGARPGHGDHPLPFLSRAEVGLQFLDVIGEVVGATIAAAAQGMGGVLIGAGRAAQAQFDTPGIERGEGAELFGNHQRRMVGQHHAASAQADFRGAGGQIADQH